MLIIIILIILLNNFRSSTKENMVLAKQLICSGFSSKGFYIAVNRHVYFRKVIKTVGHP